MYTRWEIAGGIRGDYGVGSIYASGGRGYGGGFLRPPPHYGWGARGGYGWGGPPHAGLGVSVTINDIGAFFRSIFRSDAPAANRPRFYPAASVDPAGGYQQGGTLNGLGWRPVAGPEGRIGPAAGPDAGREQPLVQGDAVVLNPHARQRPVSIAANRVTTDLPTAPRGVTEVDLVANPNLRLAAADITQPLDPAVAQAPAANAPSYLDRPDLHIGNG